MSSFQQPDPRGMLGTLQGMPMATLLPSCSLPPCLCFPPSLSLLSHMHTHAHTGTHPGDFLPGRWRSSGCLLSQHFWSESFWAQRNQEKSLTLLGNSQRFGPLGYRDSSWAMGSLGLAAMAGYFHSETGNPELKGYLRGPGFLSGCSSTKNKLVPCSVIVSHQSMQAPILPHTAKHCLRPFLQFLLSYHLYIC